MLGWPADPPTRHGFGTDLWSARRVAHPIVKRLGVTAHPHDLREWRGKRNYAPQKPARRAKQRDRDAIDPWLEDDWPRIKTTPTGGRPTSS